MTVVKKKPSPSGGSSGSATSLRKLIQRDPYLTLYEGKPVRERGRWPTRWVACPDTGKPPFVTAYRRRFTLERSVRLCVHVSADERYELFLDGRRIGRGSERGDPRNWYYETYEWDLPAGDHVVVARVWTLGDLSPLAQMSVRPGFLLSPDEKYLDLLGTGVAAWEAKELTGYDFTGCWPAFGVGANLVVNAGAFPWGFERGEGDGWKPVEPLHHGADADLSRNYKEIHLMRPAALPSMMEAPRSAGRIRHVDEPESENTVSIAVRKERALQGEAEAWESLCGGGSVTVEPRKRRRIIVDLENYFCAYPKLITTGGNGSVIRIRWAEALYEKPIPERLWGYWWQQCPKGNRDQVEGKYFYGLGDVFRLDGAKERSFDTLWWQSGRYLEIYVETASEALTIDGFCISETRYPLEMESTFSGSDPALSRSLPIMLRGLQMCSHEIYMDCPYYEQLMYVGDTRLEALTTYVITADHRLPRKALMMFDASRLPDGLTQCRYPTRLVDIMPPFSLWWAAMVYDYALWHDEPDFVRRLMPPSTTCAWP